MRVRESFDSKAPVGEEKKVEKLATQPGRRRIFIWDAVLRVIQYNGQGRQHVLDGVTITA